MEIHSIVGQIEKFDYHLDKESSFWHYLVVLIPPVGGVSLALKSTTH